MAIRTFREKKGNAKSNLFFRVNFNISTLTWIADKELKGEI